MEGLNALVNLADARRLPKPLHPRIRDRAFMHADDVVIFLQPDKQDLILTRGILEIFARASGLKTNEAKCMISPIQCDLEVMVMLLKYSPGKLDPFPIHYLKIPLGLRRLSKGALQTLIDKVTSRLTAWKAGLLNRAGRTVLIKCTLSAISTHTALVVSLSPWALKCIDSIRRGFLWRGAQSAKGGHCLLAWPRVCHPPELGGLGITDLQRFGDALRMRWLWLRRTEDTYPCQLLPDEQDPVVIAMFQASTYFELGNA